MRIDPIRRSWPAAWWEARLGVDAGVPLDDFLRSRLARYLAHLPIERARLPLCAHVEDGAIVVRAAPPMSPPDADAPQLAADWLAPLEATEGPAVRREVADLEARLTALDRGIEEAHRRSEDLSRRMAADIASGALAAPGAIEATPEQLGRPPVHGPGVQIGAALLALAAVLAETWQIAAPLLRGAGVDPSRLAADASRRALEVAFVSAFALGVSAALFVLAHAALEAASGLAGAGDAPDRRSWAAATGLGATALALVLAASASGLRAPATGAAPRTTWALLLAAVPLATAILLRGARSAAALRATERAAALEWDRERARALAERTRRLEELSWAEQEERQLGEERAAAHRRLRDLGARAITAARIADEAVAAERAALARLAQSLVGALELDRFEFLRQASLRGDAALLTLRRRKAEPRAAFVEAPAAAAAGVEASRVAS